MPISRTAAPVTLLKTHWQSRHQTSSILFNLNNMYFYNHALIGAAANIPISDPTAVLSYSPVVLPAAHDRSADLELRVSAPAEGTNLPVVVLSHGHGQSNYLNSLEGYTPTADFLAGHGFVVIQPTHLDGKSHNLTAPTGDELFWHTRVEDVVQALDSLDTVETTTPFLKGRLDRSKMAIIGHSLGGLTAQLLLGARNTDPRTNVTVDLREDRFSAGVILSGLGTGGDNLTEGGREEAPYYAPDYTTMITPTLVVFGEIDQTAHLTWRPNGDWHADPYFESPGSKALLNITGGHHALGGVSGWDALETQDESVERLQTTLRLVWAYLRSQLYEGDKSWNEAVNALERLDKRLAFVKQKSN